MLKSLINRNFFKGTFVYGVHVHITDNGISLIKTLLKKVKGEIVIVGDTIKLNSIDQFCEKANKKYPIMLTIEGKGILFKKNQPEKDIPLILHLLPNVNPGDFYTKKYEMDESNCFIAGARRNLIDGIIDEFRKSGFLIINVDFGPLSLLNLTYIKKREYFADHYQMKIINNQIDINKSKNNEGLRFNQIGTYNIDAESIISFSTGIGFYMEAFQIDEQISDKENFLYKQVFEKIGTVFLAFLFFTLLINYFLFSRYSKQKTNLNTKYSYNLNLAKKLDSLQNELKLKEEFMKSNGIMSNVMRSYYIDQIAMTIPMGIWLDELDLFPLESKMKDEELVKFHNKIIILKGETDNSPTMNTWLRKLKSKEWVKDIQVVSYKHEIKDEPAYFIIEMEIKP